MLPYTYYSYTMRTPFTLRTCIACLLHANSLLDIRSLMCECEMCTFDQVQQHSSSVVRSDQFFHDYRGMWGLSEVRPRFMSIVYISKRVYKKFIYLKHPLLPLSSLLKSISKKCWPFDKNLTKTGFEYGYFCQKSHWVAFFEKKTIFNFFLNFNKNLKKLF